MHYQEPVDPTIMNDIQASFSQLQVFTPIQDLMDIRIFLDPAEEFVRGTIEDVDSQFWLKICLRLRRILQRKQL